MPFDTIFKSFSSLFDNNNNNSDNIYHDSNLNQGREFLNYELGYKNKAIPHLKPLQLTTSPNLSSIVESLENQSTVNNSTATNQNQINTIENKFNQKITEYSNTYKLFVSNLMENTKHNDGVDDNIKYRGKVVKNKDRHIYVNDYGFTHKYMADSWNSNDTSCPKNAEEIDNDTYNFLIRTQQGPNMGSGQACKIAGQNIQNIETNETAWVDVTGFKHVYPPNVWNNKRNSCNITPIKLSSTAYNNIPTSTPMEDISECFKMNVDMTLWKKLQTLNDELMILSKELLNELNKLNTNDSNLNKEILDRKMKINEYIKSFENNKIDIDTMNSSYETAAGKVQQSSVYTKSSQYQYTIWVLLAILILIAIIRTSIDGQDTTFISGIVVVIFLFILYYILKILY